MRWFGFIAAALLVAACSSAVSLGAEPELEASSSTSTTTTTQAPNRPPEVRVVSQGRAEVGQRLTESILGFDPDGDDVVVTLGEAPLGFAPTLNTRGRVTGFSWEPVEPGEWTVEVVGVDPEGATTSSDLTLIARNPRSLDLVLAMGDSVAAGFGRDRSDLLGNDDCFRSEDSAYGLQSHGELVDVGALRGDAQAWLLACADATLGSMSLDPVEATDPAGAVLEEPPRSQMQWAIDLNPTIITITAGIADTGLFDPEQFGAVTSTDSSEFANRLELIEDQLTELLGRLVTTTDAHIAITTYYDPTAADPVGIENCESTCFTNAYGARITALNSSIEAAVNALPEGRVSLVRLDGVNDVWEAGNAVGPDGLRDGLGPLQGVIDRFTGGGGATCAASGEPNQDLVSGLDCLHPNKDGHNEITRLVVDALLSI